MKKYIIDYIVSDNRVTTIGRKISVGDTESAIYEEILSQISKAGTVIKYINIERAER